MRILVVTNLFPPHCLGGYEILCGQVCRALEERGEEIFVLTSDHGTAGGEERNPPDLPPERVERSLEIYPPFGMPPRIVRRLRWRVGRRNRARTEAAIARVKPDIVFVWSQLRLTLGPARAAEASGVPVAYTFNDEHIAGYRPSQPGPDPRSLCRFVADNWIFPSITYRGLRFERATCISRLLERNLFARGVPLGEVRVIHQGIPIERFPPKEAAGAVGRPARVLYAGQLLPDKGVHTLVEAAGIAARGRSAEALAVTVAGAGPAEYAAALEEAASRSGAAIRFTGKVPHDEMPRLYREHDIFVFPSIWEEPFGLTHLEAMASGTPVISTAGGGQDEFIEDGGNALVFEKGNAADLAAKILKLAGDPGLARRLALAARRLVEQRFTVDRYAADLAAFLGETAKRRSA